MKKILTRKSFLIFLLVIGWMIGNPVTSFGIGGGGGGGSRFYEPNAATFSGTATYCQGATPTPNSVCANYTTCMQTSGGGGTVVAVTGNVQWFYMTPAQYTTWTTAGGVCANAATYGTNFGGAVAYANTTATGSICTTPTTAVAPGTYYYFLGVTGNPPSATSGAPCAPLSQVWCNLPITIIAPGAGSISGTTTLCAGGNTTTLTGGATGGTWSSSNPAIASINVNSGFVTTGVAGTSGTTVITYQGAACATTATVTFTVNPGPSAILGITSLCAGGVSTTLSDPVGGGTWTSSNPAVASIGLNSGLVTSGTSGVSGTTTITYANTCGSITTTVTVTGIPAASISGVTSICSGGSTTNLSNTTAGGTWSSNNNSVATVGSLTGHVTSGIAGTAVITYATSCGAAATATVTSIAGPPAISGPQIMCSGGVAITLTDATTGGVWSSSVPSVASLTTTGPNSVLATSGTVAPGTIGTTVIAYTTVCGTPASFTLTVTPQPSPTIVGTTTICQNTSTTLSDFSGGTWSSSAPTIATIGSNTGVVTGLLGGTSFVSYDNGCGVPAQIPVTVTAIPPAITGPVAVCTGSFITLSNTLAGGTWSSNNANVTVNSTSGVVTGVHAGNSVITYSNGCWPGPCVYHYSVHYANYYYGI